MATVVAVGVTDQGERQILGVDAGPSEDEAFWTQFLRHLVRRGLDGVQLVISDAHAGLKAAISKILPGASWQRCRVHFMRTLLATLPKAAQQAVAAFVRTIFAQPDHASAMAQLERVLEGLRQRFPQGAELLEDAAEDLLAHFHFPAEHRRRLHSTNPLERLHKEVKRRTHVVGIFPNRKGLLRLVGMLLTEQDDEWAVADRRYFSLESMRRLYEPEGGGAPGELVAAIA
jgi:transposase-like protein